MKKRAEDYRCYRLQPLELLSSILSAKFRRTCALELIKFVLPARSKIWNFRRWRLCGLSLVKTSFAWVRKSPEKFRFALYCGVDIRVPDFPQGEDENFPSELYGISLSSSQGLESNSVGGFRNPSEDNNKLIPSSPPPVFDGAGSRSYPNVTIWSKSVTTVSSSFACLPSRQIGRLIPLLHR